MTSPLSPSCPSSSTAASPRPHPRLSRRAQSLASPDAMLAVFLANQRAKNQRVSQDQCDRRGSSVSAGRRGSSGGAYPVQVRKQFHKTAMCTFYLEGRCPFSAEDCAYCHDACELRPSPDLTKTKLCPNGADCLEMKRCPYAHEVSELRGTRLFFKSRLCKFYEQTGSCALAEKCRFAHGEKELVDSPDTEDGPAPEEHRKAVIASLRRRSSVVSEEQSPRYPPTPPPSLASPTASSPILYPYMVVGARRWSVCPAMLTPYYLNSSQTVYED